VPEGGRGEGRRERRKGEGEERDGEREKEREGDRKEVSFTAEALAEPMIHHSLTDLDFDIHVTRCHQHVKQILL